MTTQTVEWEEEASRLFDQFDPDAARPVHWIPGATLAKASNEERARELGRSTISVEVRGHNLSKHEIISSYNLVHVRL